MPRMARSPIRTRSSIRPPGTGAMLCFVGYALMENRPCLIVQEDLTRADSRAERCVALCMSHLYSLGSIRRPTLSADQGFDTAGFVADL